MLEYDFNEQFNDKEFENLGCDIVEIREDFTLERHNKVKDLGIDGRNITNDKVTIVQCKHYKDFKKLMDDLKKIELDKVKKLNPERYILVLSLNITVKQKEKIQTIFNGYIKSTNDIIGKEDLNGYFRKEKYQTIKKYYDDLLLSKNVNLREFLEKIKNPVVAQNSKFLLKDIEEIKEYFIETKTFLRSYELLKENHIIFLSGDAGSGKTTNAKMLLNNLLKDDLIDMAYKVNSCDELMSIIDTNERQGILFDDFWGSTFEHLKLGLNEEKKLQDIIEKVEKLDNIYFILTTREYVLNQGISFYKDFNNKYLDKRVIHKNCNYSDTEKIKILFSHAKNSHLDFQYLEAIKFCAKEIINKANYSPRTVSFFINKNEDFELSSREFIDEFLSFLHNPTKYLESIFYKLSEGSQILAFTLSITEGEVLLSQLQKSFQSIAKNIATIKPSKFEEYLKELLDFFLEIYREDIISFSNYSINDFVNQELLKKMVDYEDALCKGVIYFNQIYYLLTNEKYQISTENVNFLVSKLINEFDNLVITQDLDEFIDAEESENINPFYYKSHKIWKSLHILKQYNIMNLKEFLKRETYKLLNYYIILTHDYECNNFVNIPDIVKYGEKLGIKFDEEEIVKKYIYSCEFFYELYYTKVFPKSYKETVNKYMHNLGSELGDKVEDWILEDLDFLSEGGISMEYEQTIEDMAEVLKMLGLKPTKTLQNMIEENKEEKIKHTDNGIEIKSTKNKKEVVDKEIKKFENDLYSIYDLTDKKLRELIKLSSLSEKNKTKVRKSINAKNSIWNESNYSSIEYATMILKFYQETEKQNEDIITDYNVYYELTKYIKKKINIEDITFLEEYAYNIVLNDYESLSKKHFVNKYKIKEEIVKALIELGIFKVSNNIISFSDKLFTTYLSILYSIDKKDPKLLQKSLENNGDTKIYEFKLIETINAYNFHHYILIPIIEKILNYPKDKWIEEVIDININKDRSSEASLAPDIGLLEDFLYTYTGEDLHYNICEIFLDLEDLYTETISVKTFYFNTNNKNKIEWQKLDNVLNEYYKLIEDLYINLKSNESKMLEIKNFV